MYKGLPENLRRTSLCCVYGRLGPEDWHDTPDNRYPFWVVGIFPGDSRIVVVSIAFSDDCSFERL